jgi:hypothetical protein
LGQFPGQGMFTATRADYQDLHRVLALIQADCSSMTALV